MNVDHLWAPWRLEYIQGDKAGTCPFCEMPKETPSADTLVLYRDERAFVILNKFPYNPGHLMVIPRAHLSEPQSVASDDWAHCAKCLQVAIECLTEALAPQGFNVGMNVGATGGAGLPGHVHWHVLPRWNGDTNFMPLLADTKAIPAHNRTTYEKLEPHFRDFAARLARR